MRILGTGAFMPEKKLSNDDLAQMVDTSDEWITSRTGISNRRVSSHESMTDLCVKASHLALENAKVSPLDIDLIICATLAGDYITPSQASLVQREIGAACPAFDVNAACSGFIYGLDVADAYLKAGKAQKILLIAYDVLSRFVDWTDRNTCVLFGDGGGAVVLEAGDELKGIHLTSEGDETLLNIPLINRTPFNGRMDLSKDSNLSRDSNEHVFQGSKSGRASSEHVFQGSKLGRASSEHISYDSNPNLHSHGQPNQHLYMNGQEVFRFAVNSVVRELRDLLEKSMVEKDDLDFVLLHQANIRIIDLARQKLKIPEEKFVSNLEKYGNTSAGSIPVLLDELNRSGRLKKGDLIALVAFGGGLTTGACLIEWNPA